MEVQLALGQFRFNPLHVGDLHIRKEGRHTNGWVTGVAFWSYCKGVGASNRRGAGFVVIG